MVSAKIMTVELEQHSAKYQGTGVANDTFPVPFSFRHTDALIVETIASNGTATVKTIITHYDVVQMASSVVSGSGDSATNVITSNSQRTEYGWIIYKPVTTDIVHIYKEETPIQSYDFTDAAAIPAEQFEVSCDRVADCFPRQLSRNIADPSAYTAHDRKITNLRTPVRDDDLLTKGVLDDMGTTASLTIPASGGAGDNGKLLVPTGLAPSTPVVAWADRLSLPSTSGTTMLYVLSPVSSYGSAPFIEWTIPRWIQATPDDGLRSVYNYGTGSTGESTVEGEGSAKSATWREFREMLDTPSDVSNVNKVIQLKSTTWSPPEAPVAGLPASYVYESPREPTDARNEGQLDLRMMALKGGSTTVSPRMVVVTLTVNQLWESGGTETFGNNDGTKSGNETFHVHPTTDWSLTNTLKDDSGNLVMPQMVFMQCHTNAFTVPASGAHGSIGSTYSAYPVYKPTCQSWRTPDEYMPDYTTSDGTANNTILGHTMLMNANRFANSGVKTDDSNYLYWASAEEMIIKFLLVYNESAGL